MREIHGVQKRQIKNLSFCVSKTKWHNAAHISQPPQGSEHLEDSLSVAERIHLFSDSTMDHLLKAERGNEGRDRERNGEITVISMVGESDCG